VVEEKKPAEGEAAAAPKPSRRRLKLLIAITGGAMLAGVGAVTLLPRPGGREVAVVTPRLEIVHLPDEMKISFNPRTEKGAGQALVAIALDVRMDLNKEAEIREQIKARWNRANSRVMLLLKDQPASTFTTGAEPLNRLRKELCEELTHSLFPNGIARVEDVIYKQVIFQR
jgi:hypothetical protein